VKVQRPSSSKSLDPWLIFDKSRAHIEQEVQPSSTKKFTPQWATPIKRFPKQSGLKTVGKSAMRFSIRIGSAQVMKAFEIRQCAKAAVGQRRPITSKTSDNATARAADQRRLPVQNDAAGLE
jgi:hypothetical protein